MLSQNCDTFSERNSVWVFLLPYKVFNYIKGKSKILLQINAVAATNSLEVFYVLFINTWKSSLRKHKTGFRGNNYHSIFNIRWNCYFSASQKLDPIYKYVQISIIFHFKLIPLWKNLKTADVFTSWCLQGMQFENKEIVKYNSFRILVAVWFSLYKSIQICRR